MGAADFTEEEVFTEEAGSGAEDFMAGAGCAEEGFVVEVDSTGEVGSEAEVFVVAARFAAGPDFEEEPFKVDSAEVFVAMASGAVSGSADEALDGEAGAGVGA